MSDAEATHAPTITPTTMPDIPPGTLDVMIDLETLSTRADAAIVSIGAVWFNPQTQQVGQPIHLVVDMADSIRTGGHVDGNTVAWWLALSDAARQSITTGKRLDMAGALVALGRFLCNVAPDSAVRVWGNGADFDMTILASAYARLNLPLPWRYYNARCFRTLRKLHPDVQAPQFASAEHNAADDALHQALHALAILAPQPLTDPHHPQLAAEALRAVNHRIRRIVADGRLAYLIGPGSESWDRLMAAAALGTGQTPEQYAASVEPQLRAEPVVIVAPGNRHPTQG